MKILILLIVSSTIILGFFYVSVFWRKNQNKKRKSIKTLYDEKYHYFEKNNIFLNSINEEQDFQIIGSSFENKIVVKSIDIQGHSLIVGGSGTGKTEKYYKSMILFNSLKVDGPSMIITDLKGDEKNLINNSYGSLYEEFQGILTLKGYKVYVINLINSNWSNQKVNTSRFNILNEIYQNREEKYRVDNQINELIQLLFPLENSKDRYWIDSSRLIVKTIIKLMLKLNIDEGDFNFNSLIKIWINFPNYVYYYQEVKEKKRKNIYPEIYEIISENIALIGSKSFKETSATISTELGKFNDNLLKIISSGHDLKLEDFFNQKSVLFIQNNGSNENYNIFTSIILKQIMDYKIEIQNSEKLIMLLDEFNNLQQFPNFSNYLDTARSKNIYFSIGIQSIQKFEDKYGSIEKYANNFFISYLLGSTTNRKELDYFNSIYSETETSSKQFNHMGDYKGKSNTLKQEKIIDDLELQINNENYVWIKSKGKGLYGVKFDYIFKLHDFYYQTKSNENLINLSELNNEEEEDIKLKKILNIEHKLESKSIKVKKSEKPNAIKSPNYKNDILKLFVGKLKELKIESKLRNDLKQKMELIKYDNNFFVNLIEVILESTELKSYEEEIINFILELSEEFSKQKN